jgi:hypothetical protein
VAALHGPFLISSSFLAGASQRCVSIAEDQAILANGNHARRVFAMSSLLEIERAADVLPADQKKELVAFLLTRLRDAGDELPPVRDIPKETIDAWVAEDEEGYRKFLAGK